MGNSNSVLIYVFFAPFGAITVLYTFRFIRTWLTYTMRLEHFRRQRQIMRERGEDVGDDERFEFELYYATWRGDRMEQIQPTTGAVRLPLHRSPPRQNFLLNNWNKQFNIPPDHDDVCSICLNKMSNVDSIINLHISQHSTSNIESKSNREVEIESQGNLVDDDPVQIPCGHIFHEKCIRNWAVSHDSCPVCRFQPSKFKENTSLPNTTNSSAITTNVNTVVHQEGTTENNETLLSHDSLHQAVPTHNLNHVNQQSEVYTV